MFKQLNIWIIHVFIPITIGGFFYISFRSEKLLMFNWFKSIGLIDEISSLRNLTLEFKYLIPSWIYFSLPDSLWVYSFSSALQLIWKSTSFNITLLILLVPFCLGAGFEILQFFKLFKGTFDIIDLLLCLLSQLLSIEFLKPSRNEKNI